MLHIFLLSYFIKIKKFNEEIKIKIVNNLVNKNKYYDIVIELNFIYFFVI